MRKLILMAALIVVSHTANALSYTLEISEEELQSKVSAMMPIEKSVLFLKVVLSEPDIDLSIGNNEIGIFSRIEVSAPGGVKGAAQAKIAGSLIYEPEKGEFYLKNPKIVTLESTDISPDVLLKVKEISQLAITNILATRPIYKLDDENLRHKLAKAVLKSIKVENNRLMVELTMF